MVPCTVKHENSFKTSIPALHYSVMKLHSLKKDTSLHHKIRTNFEKPIKPVPTLEPPQSRVTSSRLTGDMCCVLEQDTLSSALF